MFQTWADILLASGTSNISHSFACCLFYNLCSKCCTGLIHKSDNRRDNGCVQTEMPLWHSPSLIAGSTSAAPVVRPYINADLFRVF